LIVRVLALRAAMPDLFAEGSYEPVAVEGRSADRVVAFLRRHGSDCILTVIPRLPLTLIKDPEELSLTLKGTRLSLAEGLTLFNALDDRSDPLTPRNAALQQIFSRWPVALFSTRKP
jgi:maltooligosyltrehalose synthase